MMKKPLMALLLGCTVVLSSCENTTIGTAIGNAVAPKGVSAPLASPTLPPELPVPGFTGSTVVAATTFGAKGGMVQWKATSEVEAIQQFYQGYGDRQDWEILSQFPDSFIALSQDYLITLHLVPTTSGTQIYLQYARLKVAPAAFLPNASPTSPIPLESPSSAPDFTAAPESLQTYLKDLQGLNVLTLRPPGPFAPNTTVTRREYVRWLVSTNNRFYQDRPANQIREAQPDREQPLFSDVPTTDPDFGVIQGMVNAGLIDRNTRQGKALFLPDAPLTRELMVLWKAPLDHRKPIPPASLGAVQKNWGFQDSGKIMPAALGALLLDERSGELSNVRRSFGFTTLFQPQKHVSRAEAAAALWYFGNGETGVSGANLKPQP